MVWRDYLRLGLNIILRMDLHWWVLVERGIGGCDRVSFEEVLAEVVMGVEEVWMTWMWYWMGKNYLGKRKRKWVKRIVESSSGDLPWKELNVNGVKEWQSRLFLASFYFVAVIEVEFGNEHFVKVRKVKLWAGAVEEEVGVLESARIGLVWRSW